MASPRVFISSTCYDLKDIRFQLRNLIDDYGFEPVMSEYGDIFYNYEAHIQDSCLEEIKRCQLFVLVIGDNYGSLYHQNGETELPDSVTLKEFKEALDNNIYKHIFINKFVDHDYHNYQRALEKVILRYFQEHDVSDKEINKVRSKIKHEFDEQYHFAQESYRYIFYFLELIYALEQNNAIFQFETFDDIKSSLKKQWAGFMYDSIVKESSVPINLVHQLSEKIESLESKMSKLLETKEFKKNSKVTFDIEGLVRDLNVENLEEVQDRCYQNIHTILYDDLNRQRLKIKKLFDTEKANEWIERLDEIVKTYKWSKYIDVINLFNNIVPFSYWKERVSIPYSSIFELYTIVKSFKKDDLASFHQTLIQEFNKVYEKPNLLDDVDDDLPF